MVKSFLAVIGLVTILATIPSMAFETSKKLDKEIKKSQSEARLVAKQSGTNFRRPAF